MSDCKTCNGEQVLNYYGECCICCDCSDGLKIFDYIQNLQKENKKLKECVEYYAFETTDIIKVKAVRCLEELKGNSNG